jgi:hypothetical protein
MTAHPDYPTGPSPELDRCTCGGVRHWHARAPYGCDDCPCAQFVLATDQCPDCGRPPAEHWTLRMTDEEMATWKDSTVVCTLTRGEVETKIHLAAKAKATTRETTQPCPACGAETRLNDDVCNDRACECRSTPRWLHTANDSADCPKEAP